MTWGEQEFRRELKERRRILARLSLETFLGSGGQDDTLLAMATKKNPHAVGLGKRRAATAAPGEMSEIGKIGGAVGGQARANALSPKRRKEIAKKAAAARWGKKKS